MTRAHSMPRHSDTDRQKTSFHGPLAAAIPDKLYFRIGEVAELCRVPTHVLRFWQTEFPQLRPGKSGTGQRLYRKRDVETALRIKRLLHDEGYTIAGAKGVFAAESAPPMLRTQPEPSAPTSDDQARAALGTVRAELRDLLRLLERQPSSESNRKSPELLLADYPAGRE